MTFRSERFVKYFYNIFQKYSMKWYYCHGDPGKLHIGKSVSTMNTIFNVASGHIYVGDNTIFGHNCMVLTGRHDFHKGKRKKLTTDEKETPVEGYDIHIGEGCWIASGAIIINSVNIGNNVIIGAGSVVTKNIPDGCFAAGVPAKIIKYFE